MADLLMLPNQQLARRVIGLSLRANELSSAIQLSREHMASVRTEKMKSVRAEKQTAATRLADQKRHFEGVVERHQGFIEQVSVVGVSVVYVCIQCTLQYMVLNGWMHTSA